MNRNIPALAFVFLFAAVAHAQQSSDVRFVAETLVVQADGSFETDPDLGTLTFDISSQDKDLKTAYDKARQSAQRVVELAEKNGIKRDDVTLGILSMSPNYDRRNRAKSYTVTGNITLKARDLSMLGPILDGAVEQGVVEFRSLTYSLQDEEAAKQRAVAAAMHAAVGRATAALGQSGQKLGVVRYANIDVKQLVGITRVQPNQIVSTEQVVVVEAAGGAADRFASQRAPVPPPPPFPSITPEKIKVSATVQCAFQIL